MINLRGSRDHYICIGSIAFDLDFDIDLALVPLVFYVYLFKKCIGDLALVMPLESVARKILSLMRRVEIFDC